jgi:thimet oligopeptidase
MVTEEEQPPGYTIARFTPFSLVSGSHRWASFDHLTAYGSTVYVYVEDAVIAADFLAQFDRERPLDGPAGARYRKAILEPGATRPAAASIRAFLGRGETLDAFKRWLGAVERKR